QATVVDGDQRGRDAEEFLANAQRTARETLTRRDELTSRRDALRETLASARDKVSQTTYKIDSLRTLLTSLESQDEEVRRATLELIPNATSAAERVRATEGFEAALDTLLREVSKAIVVDDAQTAADAIARLRERGAGRGPLLIGGKTEGATPGVFSLKRQLSDLESLLGHEETRASGIAAELSAIEDELRLAEDDRLLSEERARSAEHELRERRSQRERAAVELDRFQRDFAVATEEQTLYSEEKEQLLTRKHGAIDELRRLEQQ